MGKAIVEYIYLHGFASSPRSMKARELSDRFRERGILLNTPDLNQGDFAHLTITRQIQQVAGEFSDQPITLIGSSLGGLTAVWLAEQYPQVERLVLLAPAFGFLSNWKARMGEAQLQTWQTEGYWPVYHYALGEKLPLHYEFMTDAEQYDEQTLTRSLPTLILHGLDDEVIPVQASQNFAATRPWIKLIELDSDHALGNVQRKIWSALETFCALPSPMSPLENPPSEARSLPL